MGFWGWFVGLVGVMGWVRGKVGVEILRYLLEIRVEIKEVYSRSFFI